MMRKVKRAAAFILAALVCVFILLLALLGAVMQETDKSWEPYYVCPGDTLYDISAEIGTLYMFEEWRYDVCKKNGIEKGGLIFDGDVILIYKEAR